MASNPLTIIKHIMRDLVNNMQIQVSFSVSNVAKHSKNEETGKYDGDLYLGKNTVFWYGNYNDYEDKYYFKNNYIFLKFLSSLRKALFNNNIYNTSSSIVVLIDELYYKTIKEEKSS